MTDRNGMHKVLRYQLSIFFVATLSVLSVKLCYSKRPNIVILFADNLGYNDIGMFGGDVSTPNIDRLGREGMKFTHWNSAAHLCSASRAALLTGRYPIRTGVYPGVFHADAVYGMLPTETTLAEYLRDVGYATSAVGKWHLGHRPPYLPMNQGFDDWIGIPYHASGGSVGDHVCNYDKNQTMWLPLYDGYSIIEQPVHLQHLAHTYAQRALDFIDRNRNGPFFLYLPFSHVHQLCAPRDYPEQETCQWSAKGSNSTFGDAVQEMDWITGQVLQKLDDMGIANNTLVFFSSDNGPWVAEKKCSGSKGPFLGSWLIDTTPMDCTACPHDYVPNPSVFRECILPGTKHTLVGVHCGQDSGLGSLWEANLRMPTAVRWPEKIKAGVEASQLASTLDIVPTVLSIVGANTDNFMSHKMDGRDISPILFDVNSTVLDQRVLFFWRDGFQDGPLKQPFGRFDVAAVKVGRYKAWIWTKSAHYNLDTEVHHNPPLLFDVEDDPAEAHPLNPDDYTDLISSIAPLIENHKASVDWTYPLALRRDPKYLPCYDEKTGCRSESQDEIHAASE